ncbi:MAG: hypothetical protein ABR526_09465 [Chthoniobacterales bacterium]
MARVAGGGDYRDDAAAEQKKGTAIVATLKSGNYTAIIRGANDTTGIALVEAYKLQ